MARKKKVKQDGKELLKTQMRTIRTRKGKLGSLNSYELTINIPTAGSVKTKAVLSPDITDFRCSKKAKQRKSGQAEGIVESLESSPHLQAHEITAASQSESSESHTPSSNKINLSQRSSSVLRPSLVDESKRKEKEAAEDENENTRAISSNTITQYSNSAHTLTRNGTHNYGDNNFTRSVKVKEEPVEITVSLILGTEEDNELDDLTLKQEQLFFDNVIHAECVSIEIAKEPAPEQASEVTAQKTSTFPQKLSQCCLELAPSNIDPIEVGVEVCTATHRKENDEGEYTAFQNKAVSSKDVEIATSSLRIPTPVPLLDHHEDKFICQTGCLNDIVQETLATPGINLDNRLSITALSPTLPYNEYEDNVSEIPNPLDEDLFRFLTEQIGLSSSHPTSINLLADGGVVDELIDSATSIPDAEFSDLLLNNSENSDSLSTMSIGIGLGGDIISPQEYASEYQSFCRSRAVENSHELAGVQLLTPCISTTTPGSDPRPIPNSLATHYTCSQQPVNLQDSINQMSNLNLCLNMDATGKLVEEMKPEERSDPKPEYGISAVAAVPLLAPPTSHYNISNEEKMEELSTFFGTSLKNFDCSTSKSFGLSGVDGIRSKSFLPCDDDYSSSTLIKTAMLPNSEPKSGLVDSALLKLKQLEIQSQLIVDEQKDLAPHAVISPLEKQYKDLVLGMPVRMKVAEKCEPNSSLIEVEKDELEGPETEKIKTLGKQGNEAGENAESKSPNNDEFMKIKRPKINDGKTQKNKEIKTLKYQEIRASKNKKIEIQQNKQIDTVKKKGVEARKINRIKILEKAELEIIEKETKVLERLKNKEVGLEKILENKTEELAVLHTPNIKDKLEYGIGNFKNVRSKNETFKTLHLVTEESKTFANKGCDKAVESYQHRTESNIEIQNFQQVLNIPRNDAVYQSDEEPNEVRTIEGQNSENSIKLTLDSSTETGLFHSTNPAQLTFPTTGLPSINSAISRKAKPKGKKIPRKDNENPISQNFEVTLNSSSDLVIHSNYNSDGTGTCETSAVLPALLPGLAVSSSSNNNGEAESGSDRVISIRKHSDDASTTWNVVRTQVLEKENETSNQQVEPTLKKSPPTKNTKSKALDKVHKISRARSLKNADEYNCFKDQVPVQPLRVESRLLQLESPKASSIEITKEPPGFTTESRKDHPTQDQNIIGGLDQVVDTANNNSDEHSLSQSLPLSVKGKQEMGIQRFQSVYPQEQKLYVYGIGRFVVDRNDVKCDVKSIVFWRILKATNPILLQKFVPVDVEGRNMHRADNKFLSFEKMDASFYRRFYPILFYMINDSVGCFFDVGAASVPYFGYFKQTDDYFEEFFLFLKKMAKRALQDEVPSDWSSSSEGSSIMRDLLAKIYKNDCFALLFPTDCMKCVFAYPEILKSTVKVPKTRTACEFCARIGKKENSNNAAFRMLFYGDPYDSSTLMLKPLDQPRPNQPNYQICSACGSMVRALHRVVHFTYSLFIAFRLQLKQLYACLKPGESYKAKEVFDFLLEDFYFNRMTFYEWQAAYSEGYHYVKKCKNQCIKFSVATAAKQNSSPGTGKKGRPVGSVKKTLTKSKLNTVEALPSTAVVAENYSVVAANANVNSDHSAVSSSDYAVCTSLPKNAKRSSVSAHRVIKARFTLPTSENKNNTSSTELEKTPPLSLTPKPRQKSLKNKKVVTSRTQTENVASIQIIAESSSVIPSGSNSSMIVSNITNVETNKKNSGIRKENQRRGRKGKEKELEIATKPQSLQDHIEDKMQSKSPSKSKKAPGAISQISEETIVAADETEQAKRKGQKRKELEIATKPQSLEAHIEGKMQSKSPSKSKKAPGVFSQISDEPIVATIETQQAMRQGRKGKEKELEIATKPQSLHDHIEDKMQSKLPSKSKTSPGVISQISEAPIVAADETEQAKRPGRKRKEKEIATKPHRVVDHIEDKMQSKSPSKSKQAPGVISQISEEPIVATNETQQAMRQGRKGKEKELEIATKPQSLQDHIEDKMQSESPSKSKKSPGVISQISEEPRVAADETKQAKRQGQKRKEKEIATKSQSLEDHIEDKMRSKSPCKFKKSPGVISQISEAPIVAADETEQAKRQGRKGKEKEFTTKQQSLEDKIEGKMQSKSPSKSKQAPGVISQISEEPIVATNETEQAKRQGRKGKEKELEIATKPQSLQDHIEDKMQFESPSKSKKSPGVISQISEAPIVAADETKQAKRQGQKRKEKEIATKSQSLEGHIEDKMRSKSPCKSKKSPGLISQISEEPIVATNETEQAKRQGRKGKVKEITTKQQSLEDKIEGKMQSKSPSKFKKAPGLISQISDEPIVAANETEQVTKGKTHPAETKGGIAAVTWEAPVGEIIGSDTPTTPTAIKAKSLSKFSCETVSNSNEMKTAVSSADTTSAPSGPSVAKRTKISKKNNLRASVGKNQYSGCLEFESAVKSNKIGLNNKCINIAILNTSASTPSPSLAKSPTSSQDHHSSVAVSTKIESQNQNIFLEDTTQPKITSQPNPFSINRTGGNCQQKGPVIMLTRVDELEDKQPCVPQKTEAVVLLTRIDEIGQLQLGTQLATSNTKLIPTSMTETANRNDEDEIESFTELEFEARRSSGRSKKKRVPFSPDRPLPKQKPKSQPKWIDNELTTSKTTNVSQVFNKSTKQVKQVNATSNVSDFVGSKKKLGGSLKAKAKMPKQKQEQRISKQQSMSSVTNNVIDAVDTRNYSRRNRKNKNDLKEGFSLVPCGKISGSISINLNKFQEDDAQADEESLPDVGM